MQTMAKLLYSGKELQVNALSEWIIGIYLHEFTNSEGEYRTRQLSAVLKISSSLLVNECR